MRIFMNGLCRYDMGESRRIRCYEWRRTLVAAVVAAAVLLCARAGIQAWAGYAVSGVLGRCIAGTGAGVYVGDVDRVELDMNEGSVSLFGTTIRTVRRHGAKTGPVPVVDVAVDRITLSGIGFGRGRAGAPDSIDIGRVEIEGPTVRYEGVRNAIHPAGGADGRMPLLSIGSVSVADASLRLGAWIRDRKSVLSADGATFSAAFVHSAADTALSAAAMLRLLSELSVSADCLSCTVKGGAMAIEADSLEFDMAREQLSAGRLALLPQYGKEEYALRVGDRTDWVSLDVRGVECTGVRLPHVADRGELFSVDSVSVAAVYIEAYKDRNRLQTDNITETLYETIWRIPVGIEIPAISVEDIDIRYEEISAGRDVAGVITFDDMSAQVHGFTNRPVQEGQMYLIHAAGQMMGRVDIDVELSLPVAAGDDRFTLSAYMGSMPAPTASPVTEPIASVAIVSGWMHSATVEIEGTSARAESAVCLVYDDLRINLLHGGDPQQPMQMLSGLANDALLRGDNPSEDGLRVGYGTYERDCHKSFWNYIWKTSFAGVMDLLL